MRAAPPVRVPVSPSALAAPLAALCALAAGGFAAWVVAHAGPFGGRAAPAAAAALCGALGAMLAWRFGAQAAAVLAWDGGAWHWQDRPGRIEVKIDAGAWMLLTFVPAEGRHRSERVPAEGFRSAWLAVAAPACGPAWHGLRAAVYSRASILPR